jgi:hypothetical protein
VLSAVSLYLNRGIGAAFPSYTALAKAAGITRRNAIKEIKTALKHGYVARLPRARQRGGLNQYDERGEFFYFPAIDGQAMVSQPTPSGGSTVSKTTGDGVSVNEVRSQDQEVTSGTLDITLERKKEEENSKSLPRLEGKKEKQTSGPTAPSDIPFNFPALLKAMDGAATGRDGGAYLRHPDAMAALAAFERARGRPFPRDGRGGCQLSRKDFGAFNQWIASWMRPERVSS